MSKQRNLSDVVDIIIAGLAERGYMIVKADEIASLRAQLVTSQELCTKFEAAVGEDVGEIMSLRAKLESARKVIDWVESWVHNPVGSYSVAALDGLFAMTRDRITALTDEEGKPPPAPSLEQIARVLAYEDSRQEILATSDDSELHHAGDGNWKDFLPLARAVFANFLAP